MRFFVAAAIGLAIGQMMVPCRAADVASSSQPPRVDKPKLESYLRYAEGFSSSVKFAIDDPVPAPMPGYFRLVVHLSMGEARQEKIYYLTGDGKRLLTGAIWDLNDNPFLESLEQLPVKGPSFGPADAKVSIVVFSDFQCPYCREFARNLRGPLTQKYPKDVRVTFEDFPIDSLHPWATAAAEAGHCIGDEKPDLFWAYHDWIFEHQGEITVANLREKVLGFAREHHLDEGGIASCLNTHAKKAEVEASLRKGRELGIQQTPTFYLNGRPVPGALPWDALNTLIQMELNRPGFIPEARTGK